MGTWGPGLYSNDIARDLKSTISAVLKLPFENDRLVEMISSAFPEASGDPEEEDYTTFWLVLADQFSRQGVVQPDVFKRALAIIETGQDLSMARELDMGESDLKKRGKVLEELRQTLSQPIAPKPRKTLQKPQPLVMVPGDLVVYPIVATGGCFNPYSAKAKWTAADWGAALILEAGHAFEYLAYYRPLVINQRLHVPDKPDAQRLQKKLPWRLGRPGTCSKPHYQRMQLEQIDRLQIDVAQLPKSAAAWRPPEYAAVNDISLSNSLYVPEHFDEEGESVTIFHSLAEIARSR